MIANIYQRRMLRVKLTKEEEETVNKIAENLMNLYPILSKQQAIENALGLAYDANEIMLLDTMEVIEKSDYVTEEIER